MSGRTIPALGCRQHPISRRTDMNHRICLAFVFAAAVASPALAQQSFNQAPSYPSTPQQAPQSGHIGDYNTMPMQQQSVPQQQGGYPQQQDGHSPPGAGYAPT